jgi:acyl-ACP thioesterase
VPRAFAADLEKLPECASPESENTITVRWSDLDVNQHVNNSRYAEWVVDGVAARSVEILTSLDIDFLAETQHPGTVVVRTRREDPVRKVHTIVRAGDGVEFVRARTGWRAG